MAHSSHVDTDDPCKACEQSVLWCSQMPNCVTHSSLISPRLIHLQSICCHISGPAFQSRQVSGWRGTETQLWTFHGHLDFSDSHDTWTGLPGRRYKGVAGDGDTWYYVVGSLLQAMMVSSHAINSRVWAV